MTREEFIRTWLRLHESRCFYCGTGFGAKDTLLATSIEHVYPKHRFPKLELNEVKACRGCNFAKNGFMPEEFRDWLTQGDVFYSEWRLGEPLPPVKDPLRTALRLMIDAHFDAEIKRIRGKNSPRYQITTQRLREIMRNARKKVLDIRAQV